MCCRLAAGRSRSDQSACSINSLMCVMSVSLQLVATRGYHVEGAEVDTQSCMDQSILAIFENSTVPSEVRTKAGDSGGGTL